MPLSRVRLPRSLNDTISARVPHSRLQIQKLTSAANPRDVLRWEELAACYSIDPKETPACLLPGRVCSKSQELNVGFSIPTDHEFQTILVTLDILGTKVKSLLYIKIYLLRLSKLSIYPFVSTPIPCANLPGPAAQSESPPIDCPLANLLADLLGI